MSNEETVTLSWFDRVKSSAAGVGVGFALVAATTGFLFWNEGRAVQTARSLTEGSGLVVTVSGAQIDPAQEGRLIHLTGQVTTDTPLLDAEFGVTAPGLVLLRQVEMFQWIEKSQTASDVKTGGSETRVTRYSYEQGWSATPLDASTFHQPEGHANPQMLAERAVFVADDAELGAFSLGQGVIGQLGFGTAWAVPADQLDAVQAAVGAGMRAALSDGAIRLGRDPARPEIGDYRIRYTLVPLGELSVVGRQAGNGIASFRTDSGDSLLMVARGTLDAKSMFADAASSNSTLSWIFRIGGVAVMIAGFAAILAPLAVLASVLPFLGSILTFGTRGIAVMLGLGLGGGTMTLAWFVYRPLLSAMILGAVAMAIIATLVIARNRRGARPVEGVPPAA